MLNLREHLPRVERAPGKDLDALALAASEDARAPLRLHAQLTGGNVDLAASDLAVRIRESRTLRACAAEWDGFQMRTLVAVIVDLFVTSTAKRLAAGSPPAAQLNANLVHLRHAASIVAGDAQPAQLRVAPETRRAFLVYLGAYERAAAQARREARRGPRTSLTSRLRGRLQVEFGAAAAAAQLDHLARLLMAEFCGIAVDTELLAKSRKKAAHKATNSANKAEMVD